MFAKENNKKVGENNTSGIVENQTVYSPGSNSNNESDYFKKNFETLNSQNSCGNNEEGANNEMNNPGLNTEVKTNLIETKLTY